MAAVAPASQLPTFTARDSSGVSRHELRLFAALTALAIMVIATRAQILRIAHLSSHYPLLF